VREQRFRAACRVVATHLRAGRPTFSPIVHSHALVEHGLPTNWKFWEPFNRPHVERCSEVVVLMLAGWETSIGVQAEIKLAKELGRPVRFVEA
jgi:hypothetical protein